MKTINDLVNEVGGLSATARAFSVSRQKVEQWVNHAKQGNPWIIHETDTGYIVENERTGYMKRINWVKNES